MSSNMLLTMKIVKCFFFEKIKKFNVGRELSSSFNETMYININRSSPNICIDRKLSVDDAVMHRLALSGYLDVKNYRVQCLVFTLKKITNIKVLFINCSIECNIFIGCVQYDSRLSKTFIVNSLYK